MAGGNPPKPSSNKPTPPSSAASASQRKSRWESTGKKPSSDPKTPTAAAASGSGDPKSKPTNPNPKPINNSSPRPDPNTHLGLSPFLFRDPQPPPSYGFHMLERRTIVLADGSVRSYFALPHDYQDFPGFSRPYFRGMGFAFPDPEFPRPEFPDHWNPIGIEGSNAMKRKFGDEGKDGLERLRQQVLEHGNVGPSPVPGGTSSLYMGRGGGGEEMIRPGKYMRSGGGFEGGMSSRINKHNEVDQSALKKSFLLMVKLIYDNANLKRSYLADGKQGRLQCLACNRYHYELLFLVSVTEMAFLKPYRLLDKLPFLLIISKSQANDSGCSSMVRLFCALEATPSLIGFLSYSSTLVVLSSKDFPDMHTLIMHSYNSDGADSLVEHLAFHKALCVLMGWNYLTPPDNSKSYLMLSADEATANRDDLILWPPLVIIHNTITGKRDDGRMEGLGNKAMDSYLRGIGFQGGKAKALYSRDGHLGVTLVKFASDQSGFMEAMWLAEYFEKDNRGKNGWARLQPLTLGNGDENNPDLCKFDHRTGEKKRVFYGYLGTVNDLENVDFDFRKKITIASRLDYKPSG
ncbi:hypothetical protein RND71_024570 [Anisodus tanguticus]|uniref:XS domain-containing protein n=1 Tax=Anisodus tanguticus TaxID=243964 RepID=A0AAE1VBT6_9SOLA|nr:hypothetical protein RND71_024570 [Anisodus tanguticus]